MLGVLAKGWSRVASLSVTLLLVPLLLLLVVLLLVLLLVVSAHSLLTRYVSCSAACCVTMHSPLQAAMWQRAQQQLLLSSVALQCWQLY
jgi:hypothetical protein